VDERVSEKIYEEVIELKVKLDNFLQRQERFEKEYKEKSQDYEMRIRFLEKALWIAIGVLAIIQMAISFVTVRMIG
jgi:hypothetical protein